MRWFLGIVGGVTAALMLLVVGLLVADEPIRTWVEDNAAGQVQSAAGFETRPHVEIAGTPFVTHLAQRAFPSVHLTGDALGVDAGERRARVSDVDVELTDVRLRDGAWHAANAQATALLPLDQLSSFAGRPVAYAGDGRLSTTFAREVLGVRVNVSATFGLELDAPAQTLRVVDQRVSVSGIAGFGPGDQGESAQPQVDPAQLLPLPALAGLRVDGLDVAEDGVHLRLSGQDIVLPVNR
ncbi:LmeA family phospholipid-binding protein [Nigerium massiliense]|uniref:LmeA family phospholipid-binding protein n=1 Tax=Nigerium massiliense TaxID=1522317 RepID=UPI00059060BB|nr:DUF2993 domain-containing protein [Nigerium massiliense]